MALFEHFTVLDGLAQVIYQDPYEFALISKVHQMDKYSKKHRYDISEDTSRVGWEVYIGLPEMGRWWRGWWREADVMALVVSHVLLRRVFAYTTRVLRALSRCT